MPDGWTGLATREAYPDFVDDDAKCADAELAELFFPGAGVSPEPAKAICRHCPHRQPCLEWALENRQKHGVWGGTTPQERLNILKKRGPKQ